MHHNPARPTIKPLKSQLKGATRPSPCRSLILPSMFCPFRAVPFRSTDGLVQSVVASLARAILAASAPASAALAAETKTETKSDAKAAAPKGKQSAKGKEAKPKAEATAESKTAVAVAQAEDSIPVVGMALLPLLAAVANQAASKVRSFLADTRVTYSCSCPCLGVATLGVRSRCLLHRATVSQALPLACLSSDCRSQSRRLSALDVSQKLAIKQAIPVRPFVVCLLHATSQACVVLSLSDD
jgi:hypothetical protein